MWFWIYYVRKNGLVLIARISFYPIQYNLTNDQRFIFDCYSICAIRCDTVNNMLLLHPIYELNTSMYMYNLIKNENHMRWQRSFS